MRDVKAEARRIGEGGRGQNQGMGFVEVERIDEHTSGRPHDDSELSVVELTRETREMNWATWAVTNLNSESARDGWERWSLGVHLHIKEPRWRLYGMPLRNNN
jgi:hypothetical protein